MEGGDWSGFSVVCVNEEADFMAQLFPNSSDVDVDVAGYGHHVANAYHHHHHNNNNNTNDGGSYYSSDSTSNSQSLYGFSQESSYRSGGHESHYNHFLSDHCHPHLPHDHDNHHHQQHHHHQHSHHDLGAAGSNASSLPIDFLHCHMQEDDNNGLNNAAEIGGSMSLEESQMDPALGEDKNSGSSDNARKRPRAAEVQVQKGKRNVRSKKSQKAATLGGNDVNEDENEVVVNGQSTSSGSLEDDCSSKGTSTCTALNSSGKTRASRGSATDPQSLYARKRRERINERLRILQSLVPNGTKVDISTMLEEAVQYVKFLQLQIKLLSSDDLWMYAPIAYNGMNIGLDLQINIPR